MVGSSTALKASRALYGLCHYSKAAAPHPAMTPIPHPVLNALKEVVNALAAYLQDNQRSALITQSGATAQLAEAQSCAALSTDLISLYKALGGGWQAHENDYAMDFRLPPSPLT